MVLRDIKINPLTWHKPPKLPSIVSEVVCLAIRQKEFALIHARTISGKIEIVLCDNYPFENFKVELASVVRKNNLKLKPCIWVLQPKEYDLILTDALPVVNAEFQTAARWKLKDLIHSPKDDVLFDQFPIPKSPLETINKIMVAATRFSQLLLKSEDINESGLEVMSIDISELSYRNLTAFYEQDDKSTLLVDIREDQIQILITCQKQLFFNRYLNIELGEQKSNASAEERQKKMNRLEIEILRSSEYFQNQWRMPTPVRYFINPTEYITNEEMSYLSQRLGSPVKMLNFGEIVRVNKELDLIQQRKFVSLVGESLRLERAE